MCCFQVDALERDVVQVLHLVRSMKNSFALINRIPPDILSFLPDFYDGDDDEEGGGEGKDKDIIALTHVCCRWRDTFISRPSLWNRLDLGNVDKTRTYLQRSRSFPLKIHLGWREAIDEAAILIIPHIRRLQSLTIRAQYLPSVLGHFRLDTPLLERFSIQIPGEFQPNPLLDSSLFNADISSLRELRLEGVTTHFPWTNLANLQVVSLGSDFYSYGMTRILDFLESAPLLHTLSLRYQLPHSSDASPNRVVSLPHLKALTIDADLPHSVLLRHLHIPVGASLTSKGDFNGGTPLIDYLPEIPPNLENLSHITAINLLFLPRRTFTQLTGPSGSLRVLPSWIHDPPNAIDRYILSSLGRPTLSKIGRLVVSSYKHARSIEVEECPIFRSLSSANNLRTLVLVDCQHLPFVLALDPKQNPSDPVLCPNMEELVLYANDWLGQLPDECFLDMARNRALRGAKLSSITFVDRRGGDRKEMVLKLKEHVDRVECRADDALLDWDHIPCENCGESG